MDKRQDDGEVNTIPAPSELNTILVLLSASGLVSHGDISGSSTFRRDCLGRMVGSSGMTKIADHPQDSPMFRSDRSREDPNHLRREKKARHPLES